MSLRFFRHCNRNVKLTALSERPCIISKLSHEKIRSVPEVHRPFYGHMDNAL